jgi:hypothetical protein
MVDDSGPLVRVGPPDRGVGRAGMGKVADVVNDAVC